MFPSNISPNPPLRENQRFTLLNEKDCKSLAARVLSDFQKLMPEFNAEPAEKAGEFPFFLLRDLCVKKFS